MDHFFYLLELSLPVSFHLENRDTVCILNQQNSHRKAPQYTCSNVIFLHFSTENLAEVKTTGETHMKTQSVCHQKENVDAQFPGKV